MTYPAIWAKHYTPSNRTQVSKIVLHSAEFPEKPRAARALCEWAAGPQAERVSWHYAVDADEVIQAVREHDVAWAAPGANGNGIQIELIGYAAQAGPQWGDPFSSRMLDNAVNLVVGICQRWGIPATFLYAPALRQGGAGITTHAEVSLAFGKSTHTDPGPAFPIRRFMERVALQLRGWV